MHCDAKVGCVILSEDATAASVTYIGAALFKSISGEANTT
jgi:hypothetical protein